MMARHNCPSCGKRTGSWVHLTYDHDGHGTAPVCDDCARHRSFTIKR